MTTTVHEATGTLKEDTAQRLRALRLPALVIGVIFIAGWLFSLSAPRQSDLEFAPDNAREAGGRALAQVLQREGVNVRFTRSLAEAKEWATSNTTLLIANDPGVASKDYRDLLEVESDIVITSPNENLIDAVSWKTKTSMGLANAPSATSPEEALCTSVPAASAAGTLSSWGTGIDLYDDEYNPLPPTVSGCFPAFWGYHLVQITDGARTISVLDDSLAWSNHRITTAGNAALALQLLGEHDELIWLIPQDTPVPTPASGPALPLRFSLAATVVALTALLLILWKVRRLGPLISENLPVLVRSSETTHGRAKLYRASKSYGRAAAALRAGTAQRLSSRLGLTNSSQSEPFVAAIARASNHPERDIYQLFYGEPPRNDSDLVHLAQRLGDLESELNA